MDRTVNVVHGFFIIGVDDDINFILWNAFFLKIFLHISSCLIRRGIIDVNDMIIMVILHKN